MRPSNSKSLILFLGLLTTFGPLSIDLYLPAFPAMAKSLDVQSSDIQYSLTSFFIGLGLAQIVYGPISDRFGRRLPLLVGIAIFTLVSFLISLVENLQHLVVLRFIQAFGSCVSMVIIRAIVRDLYGPKEVAKVFSFILLIMGVAPMGAPLLGSLILQFFNWRALFLLLSLFGLLTFFGSYFIIKESLPKASSLKQSLSHYYQLLGDRQFFTASLVSGLTLGGVFSYISSSSIVFLEIFKIRPEIYPYIFGINALGLVTLAQLNIWLLKYYSVERILNWGLRIFFFNTLVLALITYMELNVIYYELALFSVISCIGLVTPNITAKALEFQSHRAGVASALMGSIRFSVASLGPMLVATLGSWGVWSMVTGLFLFVGLSLALYSSFPVLNRESSLMTRGNL